MHTPGPWKSDNSHKGDISGTVVWSGGDIVAVCPPDQHNNEKANAHLIAAAPELLAQLRNTVNVLALAVENGCFGDALSDDADTIDEVNSVIDAARAAIRATEKGC